MTLKTFISLTPETYKILSYLYIIIYENWHFDIKLIEKDLIISNDMFLKTLYLLKISDVVNFQIDKEKSKIFLVLGQSPIDLNIEEWPINLIILFNKIVFQSDKQKLSDSINYVYKNINKFDEESMGFYINEEIDIKLSESDLEPKKRKARCDRRNLRKIQKNKSKEIFEYFYKKYKKTHFIFITETLKSEETEEAQELCSQYPQFSVEFFKEGIDWFLDHKFHNSYVVNIEKLRNNFSKFLKEKGITKLDNRIKIR